MLGKLFKSKKTPQNDGELITQSHIANLRLQKVIELELVNMEGRPSYRLQSKLAVGSEIGEILIAEDSISPRHCTFSLEQGVITLIDHGSVNGTLVNDRAIEAGKNIILDENDKIQIGELVILIKTHNEAIVREKKAALAEMVVVEEVESTEEESEEFSLSEEADDRELITALNQLDDKFHDSTQLGIDPQSQNGTSSSHSNELLKEKGIHIEEMVKMGTQRDINTLEGFDLSAVEIDTDSEKKEQDDEEIEALFKKDEQKADEFEDEDEDEEWEERKTKTGPSLLTSFSNIFRKSKKPQKSFRSRSQKVVVSKNDAANTILRIVALHIDLSIAYGMYLLISPFDDFTSFVKMITTKGNEFLAMASQSSFYETHQEKAAFALEMFKDIWSMIDTYINPIPTLIIFVIMKLTMNFISGVSLGQLLVGIKADGNILWKRVGGVIRTVIGFITFPFLIFDIGAVISRRTFKEILTFTRLYSDSKIYNILMSLIFITLSALFVMIAPMFQGFEPAKRYVMPAKLEERIKIEDNSGEVEEIASTFSSRFFGGTIYLSDEFEILPGFKFEGSASKTNSLFVLNLFDKKMEGSSQIELSKKFEMKQLLEIGFKGNPFLRLKYPHLDNFIHQHTPVGFKRSALDSEAFAQEFMDFHRMAMDMSLESYFEHIHEVPLISSLLNYKESFIALLDNVDLEGMSFVKMGNIFAIKISQNQPKPFDYIIPITSEGKIFKITFSGERTSGIASRLYKYALYNSNWTQNVEDDFFDHLVMNLKENKEMSIDDAQSLYGYYYQLAQKVLTQDDETEYQLLRKVLNSVLLLIQGVSKEDKESLLKLEANLKDLVDAVEVRNLEYLNLSDSALL